MKTLNHFLLGTLQTTNHQCVFFPPSQLKFKHQGIYFHCLGINSIEDSLVYKSEDHDESLHVELCHDYETVLFTSQKSSIQSMNTILYCDLTSFDGIDVNTMGLPVKLIDAFENRYNFCPTYCQPNSSRLSTLYND